MPILKIDTDALTTESVRDLCYALQRSAGEAGPIAERKLILQFELAREVLQLRRLPHIPADAYSELDEMLESWRAGALRRRNRARGGQR